MLSSKGSSLTRCQTCAFMSPALAWEFLTTSATWEALIHNLTINQTAWLSQESTCSAGDLGWEDPLEEGMATHSSILAWRIPLDRIPRQKFMGSQRIGHDRASKHSTKI